MRTNKRSSLRYPLINLNLFAKKQKFHWKLEIPDSFGSIRYSIFILYKRVTTINCPTTIITFVVGQYLKHLLGHHQVTEKSISVIR